VILIDIDLPDGNGYDLLGDLRSDALTRGLPAVAVTANAMAGDARRARDAGFDEHLAKPITLAGIDAVLLRLLSRNQPARLGAVEQTR
jgi:CheY-like chemotaxis protein